MRVCAFGRAEEFMFVFGIRLSVVVAVLFVVICIGGWRVYAPEGISFENGGFFQAGFVTPAYAEEADDAHYFEVKDSGANMRSGHSTKSEVIGVLSPGALVKEIKTHNSWRYIEVMETGARGWVWVKLLKETAPPEGVAQDDTSEEDTGESTESAVEDEGGDSAVESENAEENEQDSQDEDESETKDDQSGSGKSIRIITNIENAEDIEGTNANEAVEIRPKSQDSTGQDGKSADANVAFKDATANADAGSDLIALITAESVNLRMEPNLRSDVITQVDTYMKVYIIDERKPWYFVSVPKIGRKGWVFGDFVQPLDYVVISGDDVNLREKPDMSSKVIMQLPKGMRFVKKAWQNNFILVAHPQKGITGWVHQRYANVEEQKGPPAYFVNGYSVNFREEPSIVSEVYEQLDTGTKVSVLGREEKWTKIRYHGRTGFMYSEYLKSEDTWQKTGGIRGAKRNLGADLIGRALNLRGTPYRWSGESIKGFDCSGFIYYLIGSATGATGLPRSAADMFADLGVAIHVEDLEPGDLVFFTTYKAGASHVGLYLGDGDFVHASSAKGKVVISNMSEGYYKERFIGARRVPKDFFEK